MAFASVSYPGRCLAGELTNHLPLSLLPLPLPPPGDFSFRCFFFFLLPPAPPAPPSFSQNPPPLPSLSKDCLKEGCSEQQNKNCPRIADFSRHSPEDLPASDCHRPGHGFKARLLPSSYRMLPRRRACQAHAPLFEWTNVGCLQPCLRAPLSSAPSSSSPSSSSSAVCIFPQRTRCR